MSQGWLVSILLLLLAGCADSANRPNGAVRIRWARDPETLDPLTLPNQQAIDAVNLLYLSLLQLDYHTGTYAPALATTLPERRLLGDSLTQLEYWLRPEAIWDNGRAVLATDVAFTLKLIHCPGLLNETAQAQLSFLLACRLDSADPRHVTLLCRGQSLEYPRISGDFPVLPEEALDARHVLRAYSIATLRAMRAVPKPLVNFAERYLQANVAHYPGRLPGCGPYRLLSWQPNRALVFQRKTAWWADHLRPIPFALRARPRQLQFIIVPDAAAAMLALRRHELDVFPQVPAPFFKELGASAAKNELALYTTPSSDVLMLGFNTQRPALRDKYTRQALRLLLDPAALLAATQLGQGQLTTSLLPPSSPYYNDSLAPTTYAPAQAVRLLRRAGWQQLGAGGWYQPGRPKPLGLVLRYRANDNTVATVGLQLRQAAARLGIKVELRPSENTLFTQDLRAGNFDAYVLTTKGTPFAYNLAPLLHSTTVGEGNFVRLADPATDRLLEAVMLAGQAARRQLLRRLQARLYDQVPLVPLFVVPNRLATNRYLRGVIPSSLKPGYAVTAMHWAETRPDTLTPATATR